MSSTEESRPPSLSALARGNDMIVVEVGPEHQKYKIYKELVAYYSEYFRNALKKPWKEADDRIVELLDIEPQVFDVFVDWLYTQEVPEKNRHWIPPTEEMKSNSTTHVQRVEVLIIKTYVFADRFLVPKFRCAIYNHFAASLVKDSIPPYYEVIIFAFENLTEKSPMLDLLVGVHCAFWDESCDTATNGELELRKELPVEFFLKAMIQSSKMKDKDRARSLVECGCHRQKPTEREGCESCRPEEKAEEEEEAAADGENQDGDTAQANVGDTANEDQAADAAPADAGQAADAAGGADTSNGDQEGVEATADTAASEIETQTGGSTPPNNAVQSVEASGERVDGASSPNEPSHVDDTPIDGGPQSVAGAQTNIGGDADGPAESSALATTEEGERTERPVQLGSSTSVEDSTASLQPTASDGERTEQTATNPTNNASTVIAAQADAHPSATH